MAVQLLEEVGETAGPVFDYQMVMVIQQTIGKDADSVQFRFFRQEFQKKHLFVIAGENVLSIDPPVRDVMKSTRVCQPGKSHARIL
jgi:hypothetical protein